MRVLVTGSSGFAGEILVPKLKNKGYDVIGLDWKPGNYTDIIQDISKPFNIDKKVDVFIHLAARLEHDRCTKNEYYSGNVTGTDNVIKIAEKFNSFFIYVSTTAIYGSPKSPITEQVPIKPNGDYALTKFLGEEICQKYKQKGMQIAVVRPAVLLGRKRLGIYKIIFKNLFRNSMIPLLGNGDNKISFVHIDDFTDFLVELSEKKIDGLIVNFGGVIPGDLNHIINELKKYTSSKSKILHIPTNLLGFLKFLARLKLIPLTPWQLSVMYKDYFYDNEVLYSTGFRYKYPPIDAIKQMADFYEENQKSL